MTKRIDIKKVTTEEEIAKFWEVKKNYEKYDVFPNLEDDAETIQEIIEYFDSNEYYTIIMDLHTNSPDGGSTLQFVFFYYESEYCGFAMYKIYTQEDGKAFILDFCIDKKFRNQGIGRRTSLLLEEQLRREGATYFALNTSNQNSRRFWKRNGYIAGEANDRGDLIYTKR